MHLQPITFQHDGVELIGQIATPATQGPHPTVMVMHSAHGLGERVREKVSALARLGYAAVATDMYGGGEYHADPQASGKALLELLNAPERLRARVLAWHRHLQERPEVDPQRIAAIGFCFGGLCVLELARTGADLKAVVSFHGLLATAMPAQRGAIKARIAIYTGGKDPYARRSTSKLYGRSSLLAMRAINSQCSTTLAMRSPIPVRIRWVERASPTMRLPIAFRGLAPLRFSKRRCDAFSRLRERIFKN